MKWIDRKIDHPMLAFAITFGIAVLLYNFGMRDGSLFLVDLLMGIFIYKLLSRY